MNDSKDLGEIHTPVLLDRVVELVSPTLEAQGSIYVDCTLGMGGHAAAVLRACPNARLIGFDRDAEAIAIASKRLAAFGDRVQTVHAVYDEFADRLDDLDVDEVDAVFFDLGVSSLQLDEAERGFSYMQDAPLDMRMNRSEGITAAELIAELSETELRDLFYRYGDEKLAPRYARAIVAARGVSSIDTTGQLVDILQDATPAAKRNAGHPAKRVFQALRIRVNGELDALESALPQALARTRVGGRVVVESYQSLEDRFVKRTFSEVTESRAPRDLPFIPDNLQPEFRLLTRGAEQAPAEEADLNPRAKPVRLRAVEKIRSHAA
ncbi:16S rRNA (cytosine(1402)-N(4))-methyltransferase RsmH [Gulosibacter molinativorax]|uniref:Ribosomal RNA small subunit methyltransferase H n=1 Tax=Gulosibacter molinativorax TaxID=256821 RepID=A0ABT7C5C6_9MICO|nr:16S rRNA (cytosine(1402)-N(4))-methyltransferase RsmH [Gulosibacter molinativorax]MDJ1370390.1 16S rRNA (cytosine(1402)-N(4))-methyltransferase RsmH [Gulosibacter molinativorax]QUY61303.1 Ribosomal RNA small subunit methyltransferase H [Gulosibacter molinativorax]